MLVPPQDALGAKAAPNEFQEIVITAQRRPVPLSMAPASVTVLDQAALERDRVRSSRDLDTAAPNLSIQPGVINGGAAVFGIRGISATADETLGFDNPIGQFIDGVPAARTAGATLALLAVERVEILRGPQGTLFGRNTTGGAINIITKPPGYRASLKGYVELGADGWRSQTLSLDSGEIDKIARFSFAALNRRRDGSVANLQPNMSERNPGQGSDIATRISTQFDLSSATTITLTGDWTRLAVVPWASQPVAVGSVARRQPVVVDGISLAVIQPAPVSGWLEAATNVDPGCPRKISERRAEALCLPDMDRSVDRNWGGMLRVETQSALGKLRATFGLREWRNLSRGTDVDGLPRLRGPAFTPSTLFAGLPASTLENIVGFPQPIAAFLAATPVPNTDAPIFSARSDRGTTQWSAEVDARSSDGSQINWVVGAIGISERGYDRNLQNTGIVIDVLESVFRPQFGTLADVLGSQLPFGTRYRLYELDPALLSYRIENWSLAAYAQVDVPFGAFELTTGIRMTRDSRKIMRDQNGAVPFSNPELLQNKKTIAFAKPTGHIGLSWRPIRQLLTWSRFSRGYLSGGWNARQATRAASMHSPAVDLKPYRPETLWSFELGARWSQANLGFSIAAFHDWQRNRLVTLPIPDAPTFGTIIANAGRVNHYGLEAEGFVRLSQHLRIDGSVGLTQTQFKRFPALAHDGSLIDIASLVKAANTAPWNANFAAVGLIPWQGTGGVEISAGWSGRGPRRFFPEPLSSPFFDRMRGRSELRLTLSAAVKDIPIGRRAVGQVKLWVENLGRPQAVRGVDLAQIGVATLIYSEPSRAGLSFEIRR